MKRFYYLTDNIESTEKVSEDLHAEGISDWHFHVLSKDEAGLQKKHVHVANPLHRFDIIHSGERGALIGGVLGFLIGTLAVMMSPLGSIFGMWFALLPTVVFGCFGAWVGGMVGLSHENYKIARFTDEIEAGRFLIMVDARKNLEDRVLRMMERQHPEATLAGIDDTWVSPLEGGKTRSVYEGSNEPGRVHSFRLSKTPVQYKKAA